MIGQHNDKLPSEMEFLYSKGAEIILKEENMQKPSGATGTQSYPPLEFI